MQLLFILAKSCNIFRKIEMHNNVVSFPSDHSYVSLYVTYLVVGDEDQTIISSYDSDNPGDTFREISASNKEIRIWGAKTKSSYVPIEHEARKTDWATVLVE